MDGGLKIGGRFFAQCINPDGSIAWEEEFKNGMTNVGLNAILNVVFVAGSQVTTWYAGLIDNAGFSALAVGDTMSSHGGWVESTAYSESVRQTWGAGTSTAQSTTNATVMTFTLNATVTIKGAFINSVSTKGGTTGTLMATGSFATARAFTSGQALKLTYTNSAAGA